MEKIARHTHNGIDSEQIELKNVVGFPLQALTPASSGSLTSGGTENLRNADSAIIENMRTRINELEARLQALEALL
jgi:hypothetical protein